MSDVPAKPKRALTQKYDMKALHALTAMEEDFLKDLAILYGCEEDDLPVTVDLLEVYNQPASQRESSLQGVLKGCPKDASPLISKTTEAMLELDAK